MGYTKQQKEERLSQNTYVVVDIKTKEILALEVTDEKVHDSKVLPQFLFQADPMPDGTKFKPIPVKINQNTIELDDIYHDFEIKTVYSTIIGMTHEEILKDFQRLLENRYNNFVKSGSNSMMMDYDTNQSRKRLEKYIIKR